MNKYIAFYRGQQIEVAADSSLQAQQRAAVIFKAKKRWDVTVKLAMVGCREIVHTPDF